VVASDAESELDDDLVAIAELTADVEGARLCVRRGVAYADRNRQHVFRVGPDGRSDRGTFGAFFVEGVREAHPDDAPVSPAFVYQARLR
jgi:hypothetical protein